ncbi:DUF2243 domain-containing protein [Skermanella pratensis]|uniref:DUF2243 domain-containing protein n=1 Tax=Skermanella pratensis TaxID=2233999 RepID=UPI001300F5A7|nr:DUF2243 domain-containing protein [Skermanella pratensis]
MPAPSAKRSSVPFSPSFRWAGYLLGFAFGGFFDGILLHQILQWHHLLSGLDSPALADIQVQILADGLFHLAMYAVAGAGLWLLWRTRREFGGDGADRLLFGTFLIGFGVWHIVDAVLNHWILGLHHIRMDSDSPLIWDMVFFAFGIAVTAAGWLTLRSGPNGGGGRSRGGLAASVLTLAVVIAGPVALLPPAGVSTVTALFPPGTAPGAVLAAAATVDGRVIAGADGVWIIDVPDRLRALALYREGAVHVGGSLFPIGCFSAGLS